MLCPKTNLSKCLDLKIGGFKFEAQRALKIELDLLVYLINKKSELEDLRVKVNDLTAQLSPPKTTESNFVTPVYASDLPVNPSPVPVALLSGLGACVLSIIYLLAKNMLRRSRAQSEAAYS